MRYTEKDFDFEYSSLQEWIRNSAALIIIAPLRLVNEISSKLIYLNRKLITKVLHLSVLLNAVSTGIYCGVHLWLGDFSWYVGKVPVVLQIASLVVLLGIDCWYQFYDFLIYQHTNKLLPITPHKVSDNKEITGEEDGAKEFVADTSGENKSENKSSFNFSDLETSILTELDTMNIPVTEPEHSSVDVDKLTEKLNADFSVAAREPDAPSPVNSIDLESIDEDLLAILNEELLDDETTIEYQHEADDELLQLDTIEEPVLEQEMDNSTDPSKYVSEEGLFRFLSEMGAETFGDFDIFSSYKAPEAFNLTT